MYHSYSGCFLLLVSLFAQARAHNTGPTGQVATPTSPITTVPQGKPTPIPDSTKHLQPAQQFADPHANPFQGALKYSPLRDVTNIIHNATSLVEPGGNDQCEPLIVNFNRTLAAHFYTTFHIQNRTEQTIGFAPGVFAHAQAVALDNTRNGTSILSRGQRIYYGHGGDHGGWGDGEDGGWDDGGHNRREIIGTDTRVEDLNTWPFPWSVVGLVGDKCTGTLISPRHVLTAGHCVHTGGSGGSWYDNDDFVIVHRPGVDGAEKTELTFRAQQAFAMNGWLNDASPEYDMAIVLLQTEDTGQGWMSFGYDTSLGENWRINIDGFPSDKPYHTMWHSFGAITDDSDHNFDHDADTYYENSGSGVYLYLAASNFYCIYGVHTGFHSWSVINFPDFWNTHTDTANRATRINEERFGIICSLMGIPAVC